MSSPAKRFALYAAFRSFLGVGGRLPFTLTRAVGPKLSGAALRVMKNTRQRIRTHLEIAFPDLNDDQRTRIMSDCARHFGLMLAEITWLWRASPSQVEQLCDTEGLEYAREVIEGGRGAMFATGHCGNWELLSARLPLGDVPLVSAVRQLDNPRLDELVTRTRTRFGTEIIPRGPSAGRQLVRSLTRKKVVGLLIDQDIRDIPGVFVPFFGRPAWTPSGLATLALRLDCPVLPGFIHRRPDGTHKAVIHPPLPFPEGGTLEDRVEELTAAATAVIERQIRSHPEQWVWMHRRWRRRADAPEGHAESPA